MLKPKPNEVRKPTKTISGITPVAVMLPPRPCEHGSCIYCPNLNVPQSYTPKSPVVMRAKEVDYDSYKQVKARLKAFEVMNHKTEKIEIIIMGGTFLEYPEKFQDKFIKGIYDALNNKKSKNLEEAQKLNERTPHRCVALCIETRPDKIDIEKMRKWGATRVELGVQIIDDEIYKLVKRGHKVEDVIMATRELKNAGFKIGYHVMPGLPGSNPKKDLQLFKKLFTNENFKPDQLKIYPCQVMPGSELEKLYWKKEYVPYSKEIIEKLLIKMLKIVPRYCRVMRVMREIPPEYLVAGTTKIDLRKDIEENLRKEKIKLNEIRYREIGFNKKTNTNLKLKITKYSASGGEEYFLEVINSEDILFGLCRLRIYDREKLGLLQSRSQLMASSQLDARLSAEESVKNITNSITENSNKVEFGIINSRAERRGKSGKKAIIRELHVYGPSLKLGEEGKISQHKGIGKWLISEAEKIVRQNKIRKLRIISGIGVREYYKKLGYNLEEGYMVKEF